MSSLCPFLFHSLVPEESGKTSRRRESIMWSGGFMVVLCDVGLDLRGDSHEGARANFLVPFSLPAPLIDL